MKKQYAATLNNLDVIAEDVDAFCESCGAGAAQTYAVNLCIDEIFTNIVTYGYNEDASKLVDIEINKAEFEGQAALKIVMRDSAREFNPLIDAADPDLNSALDDRCVGGLGVFFIKKNMDALSYQRLNGFNILTMLKKMGEDAL